MNKELSLSTASDTWSSVRDSFQLDRDYIHLGLGMLTPHPNSVQTAIDQHRKELNKNPTIYYRNKTNLEQLVLNRAAEYLKTTADQIAITESTTMGLALIYAGLQLHENEEIITTIHEHYAALETLRHRTKRDKIRLKHISLYKDPRYATSEEIVANILQQISDKTRLIALTWVHSCTGVKLPIKQIAHALALINASRSKEEKILLAVDGLHGFGVEDLHVEELGCDFFIAGCHKWLFGPRGTGLVWGNQKGWEKIIPIITSFKWDAFWSWFNSKNPDENCSKAWLCTPGGFQAFEHRWALGEAFDFHLSIGKKRIEERIHFLSSYCKKKMAHMSHVQLYTPEASELSSGMICFNIKNTDPAIIVEKLLEKKILIGQTPYQHSCCRLTPGILNSLSELDFALSEIQNLSLL